MTDEDEEFNRIERESKMRKQAVESALNKMAENARELGLDYEPAGGTQVSKVWWDGEKLMAKPIPLEDIYQPTPVQELAAWEWQQAPIKTMWGDEMVVADLAIDKDHTVSVYCERDQAAKVEAMFTQPAAQRQWVGLTDEEAEQLRVEKEFDQWGITQSAFKYAARDIETKLKEKNT